MKKLLVGFIAFGLVLAISLTAFLYLSNSNSNQSIDQNLIIDTSKLTYIKGGSVYIIDINTNQEKLVAKSNIPTPFNYDTALNPEFFVYDNPKFLSGTDYILIIKDSVLQSTGGSPSYEFLLYNNEDSSLIKFGVGNIVKYLKDSKSLGYISYQGNTRQPFLNLYSLDLKQTISQELDIMTSFNEQISACQKFGEVQPQCEEYVRSQAGTENYVIDYQEVTRVAGLEGYKALEYNTKKAGDEVYTIEFVKEDENVVKELIGKVNLESIRYGVVPGFTDTVAVIYDNKNKKIILKIEGALALDLKN